VTARGPGAPGLRPRHDEPAMRCPFLHEVRVKFCRATAFRKMIPESARDVGHERCSSTAYVGCSAVPAGVTGQAIGPSCPHLQDATAEYCGASPVRRYVPANDAPLSRCSCGGHRFCELYLATADPRGERLPGNTGLARPSSPGCPTVVVDGIPVPGHLSYSPNHMWLDVDQDGRCHVGIDAFLARVVGHADMISFVTSGRGSDRPVVVLTVDGVDLQLVFPHPLAEAAVNAHLRIDPAKLTADPYGAGWLFEGVEPATLGASVGAALQAGLIPGERAARWFVAEGTRLLEFLHGRIVQPAAVGTRLAADGGRIEAGLAARLQRELRISLFNEFFSPPLTRRMAV
jgi:glycine cleavage system H lipoate-binding protein